MKKEFFNFKLDKKTIRLINIFQVISLIISIIGTITLYIFLKFFISFDLYEISIIIFRTGLLAGVSSLCIGIFFNGINNNLIN